MRKNDKILINNKISQRIKFTILAKIIYSEFILKLSKSRRGTRFIHVNFKLHSNI